MFGATDSNTTFDELVQPYELDSHEVNISCVPTKRLRVKYK